MTYDRNQEDWKEIPGFPGNEGSTQGNLRTYWYRVRNKKGRGSHRERWDTPRVLPVSPKNDGYLHTNVYCEPENKRYTRNVQGLIARTFLDLPDDFDEVDYTVDHIRPGPESKHDNSIWNLQWMPRGDNVRKAYREGRHDARICRSRKPIVAIDMWTEEEGYFSSIQEASDMLNIDRSAISHVLRGDHARVGHYRFEYAGREEMLLYGDDDNKLLSWLRMGLL